MRDYEKAGEKGTDQDIAEYDRANQGLGSKLKAGILSGIRGIKEEANRRGERGRRLDEIRQRARGKAEEYYAAKGEREKVKDRYQRRRALARNPDAIFGLAGLGTAPGQGLPRDRKKRPERPNPFGPFG